MEAAVPLPVPLERDESSTFVGRDTELAGLAAAWEAARSGRRRVVLIVGEPGIGKTRLAAETRDALALAAVIGDRFELAPLVHAAGETELATLRALDPAITARMITDAGDTYRFLHALVRVTLYESLPRARRMELHSRIGEAVEAVYATRLDDHLPALAYHFARAGREQRAKASAYAARAGDRAMAQLAHNEAVGWYTEAYMLFESSGLDDEARRCDLLISLGQAQHRVGDRTAHDTLLEGARIAQALSDGDRLARAALAADMRPALVFQRVDEERIGVLHAALEATPPGDSIRRARLMATLATELATRLTTKSAIGS